MDQDVYNLQFLRKVSPLKKFQMLGKNGRVSTQEMDHIHFLTQKQDSSKSLGGRKCLELIAGKP